MLLLEPEVAPLGHDGLEHVVVVLRVQQDHVRQALQAARGDALLDGVLQALQDAERGATLLKGRHAALLGEEDGVEHVDRQVPALAVRAVAVAAVDGLALAARKVHLGLERVQHEVHLVHEHRAAAEDLQDLAQLLRLLAVLAHAAADAELAGLAQAHERLDVA